MGIDLTSNNGDEFSLSGIGWRYFLNLAEWYGWKPHNSLPPEGYGLAEGWAGSYDSCEGQIVTAEDASGFAAALEKMLKAPNRFARSRNLSRKMSSALGIDIQPLFSEEREADEQFVKRLVDFCKSGSFTIW